MRRNILILVSGLAALAIFGFLFIKTVEAKGLSFGGRIITQPATQIQTLQSTGFICPLGLSTFDIMPVKSTKSSGPYFYNPFDVSRGVPGIGKLTLGLYTPYTQQIYCIRVYPPAVTTVSANQILIMWGVSPR